MPKSVLRSGQTSHGGLRGLRDLIERSFEEMEGCAETVEPIDFMRAICQHNEAIAKELRAAGITRDTLTMAQSKSDSTREVLKKWKEQTQRAYLPGVNALPASYSRRFTRDLTELAHRGSYAGGGTR